ncbi:MAG: phosphoglycerate dehydrogenase [Sellimonas sp.]|uniref:phosphoglycerate dehydrogenase n=1 Tax=Sellimonas sp. TaxID=2021466 RepID=UPI0039A13677
MYKYHCLNAISKSGLDIFPETYEAQETMEYADAVLVRSAPMHEMEFPLCLKAVARAGAGVNNIPLEACAERGIVVFNTPGANANGVKELVIAGMLLASRDIMGGIEWVKAHAGETDVAKRAEKQKKEFAGCEIEGKRLGVIGLGAIGALVANAALHLGMEVYGYDPYLSVDSAWSLSRHIRHVKDVNEIYSQCDYITVHVPALENTKGMIGKDAVQKMKDGAVLLNFARDILVDEQDVMDALENGKLKKYVTDFPNPQTAGKDGVIVIPHLGASTEESEENCAKMAVKEIREYLENGNIRNSVNYPDCDMGKRGSNARITILHHNVPNMIGQFTAILAGRDLNIADLTNKSRGKYAYTMIDVDAENLEGMEKDIEKIRDVLKVRIIS